MVSTEIILGIFSIIREAPSAFMWELHREDRQQ